MSEAVRFVVSIALKEGQYDEFQAIARAMVDGVAKEDGAVAYDFYVSADRTTCRLYEEYRDAAATLAHLKGPVVGELVPQALSVADITAFEVYGDPGPEALAMLGMFGAVAYGYHTGFSK